MTFLSKGLGIRLYTLLSFKAFISSSIAVFQKCFSAQIKASVTVSGSVAGTLRRAEEAPRHQFDVFLTTREDLRGALLEMDTFESTSVRFGALAADLGPFMAVF